ncbi:contractile injection system tape measure protein [Serratia marcescens]|uniref:contractile injection system tape measure protein n=1 Tax=Serratia marcescens TaxID=615 RepID=UPI003204DE47
MSYINRCRVVIRGNLHCITEVKYEVSRCFYGILQHEITRKVNVWLELNHPQRHIHIDRLILNIGTLHHCGFSMQFVPRVLEALDEALNNLQLPDDDVMASDTDVDDSSSTASERTDFLGASERTDFLGASTSLVSDTEMQDRFLHYLRTGHWPPADCVPGAAPPPQVNMHSPARWLEAYLKQNKDPGVVLWPSLFTTLTEPYARQRLLACLSPSLWLLWVQQLVSGLIPVGDVNNMREPDAINLLLLLWRYRVMSAMPDLPVMAHFSPAELQFPSPVQCRDIEALALSPNGKSALRVQLGWLRRLVERFGERLWDQFSAQAQQRMLTILPEMAPILRECLPNAGSSTEDTGILSSLSRQPARSSQGGDKEQKQDNTSAGRQSLPSFARPPAPNPSALPPQRPWPERRPDVANEPVVVHHAGLVLLWPLLPRWLSSVGLLTPKNEGEKAPLVFASPQAQLEAIAVLDDLIWQDGDGGEWRCLLSKLLCGCPLQAPLVTWPSQERLDTLRTPLESQLHFALLQLQQLQRMQPQARPGLGQLTVRDLCQLFLQRPGTLTETRSGWRLTVTPHPADVMLWALPWPLEQIMFPWMTGVLDLNWEMPKLPFAT